MSRMTPVYALFAFQLLIVAAVPFLCRGEDGPVDPFLNSSTPLPPDYNGPIFKLSHNYPTKRPAPLKEAPWVRALNGKPLSSDNALLYAEALKKHLSQDLKTLILDYKKWDSARAGWYNIPWLFSIQDPIHGVYTGSGFPRSMFPLSNLKKDMTTLVVVYYNDVAGYTLGRIWGSDALHPDVTKAQYEEGAIIVKVALTTATADDWAILDGAPSWDVFAPLPGGASGTPPVLFQAPVFQIDIIVKDSKSAPQTSWVFTTFVYNKDTPGDGVDKMVALGVMWGNDADVNSAVDPNGVLKQSVINPLAPLYATETLGYGGRLSGPNDGAVAQNAIVDGKLRPRLSVSSCMSCHGVAESAMKSFLLPGPGVPRATGSIGPGTQGDYIYLYEPGSLEFNRWFQSRAGNDPQDRGTVSLDYHMNLAYKALPLWAKYTKQDRALMFKDVPSGLKQLLMDPEYSSKSGVLMGHP
ncbi:hypothetical protein ETAA8_13440 [Anatilimnocola aggregata]|uniref:Cytochrome c domain-containing protein n=1 Tax=Anatilimnocola aggregata TaxID=2528021 RepID=A0A517Y7R1_9BACT|nr:hypothetical protein [Anatilimnocola aggregata]QDU26267.1 hypothetical protein ETAA8_13440 [Anatilimnocola aggregata]